ncbi:hypothetical protein EV714DRAFT_196184, partial [Schizophyllum commune]
MSDSLWNGRALTVFDFLDLHDLILETFSEQDLVAFSGVNVVSKHIVDAYNRRSYDLPRALCLWMEWEDVHRFRILMHAHGIVISGTFALFFLLRQPVCAEPLLLLVPRRSTYELFSFVLGLGYVRLRPNSVNATSLRGERHNDRISFTRNGSEISVIVCDSGVAQTLLGFKTTCEMNVITARRAYSFYPRSTFIERTTLAFDVRGRYPAEFNPRPGNMAEGGWTMLHTMAPGIASRACEEFGRLFRYVGDDMTRVVELDSFGGSGNVDDGVLNNSWTLRYRHCSVGYNGSWLFSRPVFAQVMSSVPDLFEFGFANAMVRDAVECEWDIAEEDEEIRQECYRRRPSVEGKCDVVFIGSDGMSVTVSRAQFLRASDFALPPPSSLGNDSVVFHAAENIDVLRLLFKFVTLEYPIDLERVPFEIAMSVAEAAEKYVVHSARIYCCSFMRAQRIERPLEVVRFAAQYRYDEILDAAAPYTVGCDYLWVEKSLNPQVFRAWKAYSHGFQQIAHVFVRELEVKPYDHHKVGEGEQ